MKHVKKHFHKDWNASEVERFIEPCDDPDPIEMVDEDDFAKE